MISAFEPGEAQVRARARDLVAAAARLAVLTVLMIAVTPAVAAAATDTLAPGGTLTAGQTLVSTDGHYQLVMQSDGNLVLYVAGGRALWSTRTAGDGGDHALMQTDGNLVLYSASNQALWSSNTSGAGCAHLVLQTDGNLVLYGGNGAVWNSNTVNYVLQPGDKLTPGQQLFSLNERYRLIMQSDGNLVLYDSANKPLWNSLSWGNPGAHAIMQTDGNLVVYSTAGAPLWNSGTWGKPGGALYVQVDGNLVIYAGGTAVWNSGTVQHTTRRATSSARAGLPIAGRAAAASNCGVPLPPPPPPPPTTTPPKPVVVYVPVPVYVPAPRARRHVSVRLTMRWTWNRGHTRLQSVTVGRLPRRARITVTCRGRGCPRGAQTASFHIRRLLLSLAGHTYKAGDRIFITIRAPGRVAERAVLLIRYGEKPRARLL